MTILRWDYYEFGRYVNYLCVALVFGSVGFMVEEGGAYQVTIFAMQFFLTAFAIGALASAVPLALFAHYYHRWFEGGAPSSLGDTLKFTLAMAVVAGLFCSSAASLVNRSWTTPLPPLKTVVERKFLAGSGSDVPFIYFPVASGVTEHITVDRPFFDRVADGGELTLTLQHGCLGYDFVHAWSAP